MKSFLFLITLLLSQQLFAYPEMSRHGYFNCTTCHFSPSGGGALTLYGRELSKEVLSTFSGKGEQYFMYNAFPKLSASDKIYVSGYIRGLQVLRNNNHVKEARTILMQADAEVLYNDPKWIVTGMLGRQEVRNGQNSDGHLFSRRHFFLYRIDKNQNLKIGKFQNYFGLADPNHYMYVRKDLNFSYDTESYNFEYSFLNENFNLFFTVVRNWTTDNYFRNTENALSFNGSLKVLNKSKVGLSIYHGKDNLKERSILGLWGIATFTKDLFLMSEFDYQFQKNTNLSNINGYVTSHRLSYEVHKGVVPFISFDQKYLNQSDKNSELHSVGIGARLFPRPHFELTMSAQREERIANNLKDNLFWIMGQFYL
jgi:hypothetical protein